MICIYSYIHIYTSYITKIYSCIILIYILYYTAIDLVRLPTQSFALFSCEVKTAAVKSSDARFMRVWFKKRALLDLCVCVWHEDCWEFAVIYCNILYTVIYCNILQYVDILLYLLYNVLT